MVRFNPLTGLKRCNPPGLRSEAGLARTFQSPDGAKEVQLTLWKEGEGRRFAVSIP